MTKIHSLLKKLLIVVFALFIAAPTFALDSADILGNVGDVGDYGSWNTDLNRGLVTTQLSQELNKFAPTQSTVDGAYVPIEAKIGLALMGGMAKAGVFLNSSLVRFAIMFILLAYAFWVAFEAYNLIGANTEAKETVKKIIIKGLIISAWLIVLLNPEFNLTSLFSMIMMPIAEMGTYISKTILESFTAGFAIPDTCSAIKDYAANNMPQMLQNTPQNVMNSINISNDAVADLLCVPTQLSGFFVTTINIGWKWITSSVGNSLFGGLLGIYVTYLGLKNIWKYLFITISVVVDLFLCLLMLPFTAIAETTAKTEYKGVAGDIFNTFLGIFKTENLEAQINHIIKAILYFICLAVVIGVSVSLLTFIIDPQTGDLLPTMRGFDGIVMLILTLLLVGYMIDKAKELADKWGGKIDAGLGDTLQKDAKRLWTLGKKRFGQVYDIFKKK